MDMFLRKALIKTKSVHTLVLYIEKQNSEFIEGIFDILINKSKKFQKIL